jgi:UDP-N-acetylmuramoyl-tripeptide--D-alanyl-D-alanine ligase
MCSEKEIIGRMTLDEILQASGGVLIGTGASSFSGLSIDSRKIENGEMFVALKGDRFDGHDFLGLALERGSGAIVSKQPKDLIQGKTIIYVKDTLRALQAIARRRRLQKDMPVIAVTGSNGKTTTKELIAAVLNAEYRVLKNAGNLNNHIGLPLSLSKLTDEDEAVVVEMGASGPGEIKDLCEIALPDYGVLTNIGRAHLEGFRDVATIRRTKLELLEYVKVAVVNADDEFLMEGVNSSDFKGKIIRYGINNPADVYATDIRLHERGSTFSLHTAKISAEIHSAISGMFNIYNILAASAVGVLLHVAVGDIGKAVTSFKGVPMRLEIREINGISVISDVYNANPASMEAALRELARISKGRTIAVLGDMLELGSYSEEAHAKTVRLLNDLRINVLIAVGPCMGIAAPEFLGELHAAESSEDARNLLKGVWRQGDSVLIKGSRGMRMEKVLEG